MQNNSITWSIDERYSARFTQTVLNDIVTRNNCSQEKVVRSLTTRSVSLLKLTPPDLPDIYIKSYHIPPTKLYRSWLQPYGTKEWRVAQALTRSSISTCPPIALGLQKSCGLYRRAFFITEAVTDSLTLKEYIERCGTRSFSGYETGGKDLIDLFAEFVARIRSVGILHSDFHWGNVLIRLPENRQPEFFLIDLHNVLLKPALSAADNLSNLTLINASLHGRIGARDQLMFLRAYVSTRASRRKAFRQLRDVLKKKTESLLMKKWVKHAERCRFENKYFTKLQHSPLQGMACRSGIAGLPEAAFSNPDKLIFHPQSRILKDSNTTTSAISEPETHSTGIHIKRYNVKKPWHVLKYLVRRSRARRVWHTANSMQARDIPTPAPLFYLEKRTGGLLGPSYIVTEYIRNAVHLESFMADTFQSAGRIEKNHTIRLLAAAVQKMHARGIFHGDLKAKNILIQTPPDGRLQPCFVDLDAARVSGLLSAQQRCRDLARLNCSFLDTGQLSTTQRLRFLKYYLGRATHAELSSAWQLITSLSRRKLLKSGREFQK